jgi:hypothetical protein
MAANYQFIGDDTGFNLVQLNGVTFVSAKRFAKGEIILEVTGTTTKLIPTADDGAEFTVQNATITEPLAGTAEDLFALLLPIIY